jgi:outer membrane biosynthesis protein TonB
VRRPARRCLVLALLAACGSPQPPPDAPRPAPPSADADPTLEPAAQPKGCLPDEDVVEEPTDAGPTTPDEAVDRPVSKPPRVITRRVIEPAAQHRRALWRRYGRRGEEVIAKVCVDAEARVTGVDLVRDSGYPPFDEQVRREVSCFSFRPTVIDGTPTRGCTTVTFIYRPSPPSFLSPAP